MTRRPRSASRRVAVVAADAGRLLRHRAPLFRALLADGHSVLCLTATAAERDSRGLQEIGAQPGNLKTGNLQTGTFEWSGGRPRLFGGSRATADLSKRLLDWKPNAVVAIGFEAMLIAASAARMAQVARIVLVASSLGGLDGSTGARAGLGTRWLARRAFKAAGVIVVHNVEHEQRLRALDLVPVGLPVVVLPGAGVDLAWFAPRPLPPLHPGLVFTMIAPHPGAAGIVEFCEAARRVKQKAPGARFVLATAPGDDPGQGTGETGAGGLAARKFADCIEMVDAPADVRELLAQCHVFVYPSHGEGLAHPVLEALACGRSVITTTAPGCRDTVDERVSGVLVPPGDVLALAAAMESHLRRPDLIAWMSQAARAKAERRFDATAAAAGLIDLMELDR